MTFNCFARIFRTSWSETAGRRQPRRDYCFIKFQKRNQNKSHNVAQTSVCVSPMSSQTEVCATHFSLRATCSTILRNSLNRSSSVEVSKGRLALMTQSYRCRRAPKSVRLRRNTSRNKRFARVRSTDLPMAFVEAVTPSRCSASFARKKAAIKRPS